MKALDFDGFFKAQGFSEVQANHTKLLIIGRLVHPSSERELRRFIQEDSGLGLLLGTDFSQLSHNALYRANVLFSLSETVILYDLTNTYFEGDARSVPLAKRGWSWAERSPSVIAPPRVSKKRSFTQP